MSASSRSGQEYFDRTKILIKALENGDVVEVNRLIDELTTIREAKIFAEIGHLTRDLHESLSDLRGDPRVEKLATEFIPNAKDSLSYVVELTEESANKSLQSVEEGLSIVADLSASVDSINSKWDRFLVRDLSVDEFKVLIKDVSCFIGTVRVNNQSVGGHFRDILMAQSFQDLSGQLIKKVIDVVNEAEEKLVGIISVSGSNVMEKKIQPNELGEGKGFGPALPNEKSDNRLKNQDEVDDLLSSLGF